MFLKLRASLEPCSSISDKMKISSALISMTTRTACRYVFVSFTELLTYLVLIKKFSDFCEYCIFKNVKNSEVREKFEQKSNKVSLVEEICGLAETVMAFALFALDLPFE